MKHNRGCEDDISDEIVREEKVIVESYIESFTGVKWPNEIMLVRRGVSQSIAERRAKAEEKARQAARTLFS